MAFLSRLLSSLIIGLIALPAFAYIPDQLDIGYSNLSDTQKFLIRNGQTIPYNKEFIQRVVVGKVRIGKNGALINMPKQDLAYPTLDLNFDFEEKSSYIPMFLLIHALDVYTTYKGLKYDCIKEANPLVGERPSLAKLLLFKTGIIMGLEAVYGQHPNEWTVFQITSAYSTGVVVINNFQLTKEAKGNPRCKKR